MADVFVKRGDTAPAFRATLLDADGDPVALDDDDGLRFVMRTIRGSEVVVDEAAEKGVSDGEVVYQWQDGDTDTPGGYYAEVEVTFDADDTVETFPNDRQGFTVAIISDLGEAAS